jgi:putative DNA primase/helicase
MDNHSNKAQEKQDTSKKGLTSRKGRALLQVEATSKKPFFEQIPLELTQHNQWVLWKLEDVGRSKPAKIPYQTTGKRADTTKPDTWTSFENVWKAYDKNKAYSGVGFVLSDSDGLVGVDLDNCIDAKGNFREEATRIINGLDSYTELSPSGKGIRIFFKGKAIATGKGGDKNWMEVYDHTSPRYLTLTGRVHQGRSEVVEVDEVKQAAALKDFLESKKARKPKSKKAARKPKKEQSFVSVDDELVTRIRASSNGARFAELFDRGASSTEDHSSLDLELCNNKWDSPRGNSTYGKDTIYKSLEGRTEFYKQPKPKPKPKPKPSKSKKAKGSPQGGREKKPSQIQIAREMWERINGTLIWDETIDSIGALSWMEYHEQAWRKVSNTYVEGRVREFIVEHHGDDFSHSAIVGSEKILRTYASLGRDWKWNPESSLIPFSNGMLNIETRELKPHNPDYFNTWILPYEWNEKADCQIIKKWLIETLGPTQTQIVRAFLNATLRGKTEYQRFLELIGPEGAGKGTLQRLATALIGEVNTHTTTINALEENRFETSSIVGKRLLLISDANLYKKDMSMLRAITGGDKIRSEEKHKQSAVFQPQCGVIVATNEPLKADYLNRRRLPIEFKHKVPLAKQRNLDAEFQPFLPGFIRWILEMPAAKVESLHRQAEKTTADFKIRILLEHNPLAAWLNESTLYIQNQSTPIGRKDGEGLYGDYCRYCEQSGHRPKSMQNFGKDVVALCKAYHLQVEKIRYQSKYSHIQGVVFCKQYSNTDALPPFDFALQEMQKEAPMPQWGEIQNDGGYDYARQLYLGASPETLEVLHRRYNVDDLLPYLGTWNLSKINALISEIEVLEGMDEDEPGLFD